MVGTNKWHIAALIVGGIILGVFLVEYFINAASHAPVSHDNYLDTSVTCQQELEDLRISYDTCQDLRHVDLKDQQAGTDFLVKNHEKLKFPSCFRDLNYMTTGWDNILYVFDGNYMGWTLENFSLYCWDKKVDFFDCEELCSTYS